MNTSKLRCALIVLGVSFALPTLASAASTHSVHLLLATSAMGETKKSQAATDRQEVDGLLKSARKLLKEGNLDEADSQIKRAEKLKVEYSLFHLGDTPKKLRSDWNSAKRASKRAAVAKPSQKFAAELAGDKNAGRKAESTADAAKPGTGPVEVADPQDESPLELPNSQGRLTQSPVTQSASTADEAELNAEPQLKPQRDLSNEPDANPELRRQADAQLLAARRALAVGDVRRATTAVEAAKKMNAAYGHHDDTPERVETAVRNYRQVSESASGTQATEAARHQLADLLMDQAQQLLRWRDFEEAERLVRHVQGMRISYGPFEAKPEALLVKIAAARGQSPGAAQAIPGDDAIVGNPPPKRSATRTPSGAAAPKATAYPTTQALYDSEHDSTRNLITSAQEGGQATDEDDTVSSDPVERLPTPDQNARPIPKNNSNAAQLYRQGEKALRDRDLPKALEYFRHAYELKDELDSATAQKLQDHLQLLSAPAGGPRGSSKSESLIDNATSKQQLLLKQLSADVAQKQVAAQKLREKDAKRAMDLLKEARAAVEAAGVEPEARAQLLRRVDKSVAELDKYVTDHRAEIELDNSNKEVLKDVDRRRQAKVEVDDKLAKLVDQFNQLMDEQRYGEAEVLAKRARELDPDNTLVKQLLWQSRFVTRTQRNNSLIDDKEDAGWQALNSVERAAVPFGDDNEPYHMPDAKKWEDLTKSRSKRLAESKSRRSERDLEIERKLKTPVSLKFRNRPLLEVLEQLAKLTDINIHPDPKGLEEEGVSSDTPITIDLSQDVSLKSALHLILEPLHLSYVIKNEVLMITSEQLRDGEVYTATYSVADLVIPIPNFTPNGRQGLAGALSDAYAISGSGGMGPGTAYLASQDGSQATGVVNPQVLAQMQQLMPGAMGTRGAGGGGNVPVGPGGAGGGAQADFDSLIELITTTVKPSTWDEVGGPGSVSEFRNNLSLVISQTQDVHEEIVDLLEQLRRNQDLQVTIEVRFITLNDNFFERIGVDFQFNVVNNAPRDPRGPGGVGVAAGNLSEIVGLDTVGGNAPAGGAPSFTPNLELPFRQSSFNLATPQFGQPVEVAHFGFAILSDLEAFLLVNAAQGDRRSNVLQAPKVTLFNGQQASVSDFTQTPFVISVVPVVGDFAAAYQPIITVLSEGTYLSVQAVISNDRRFVRLTVIPFFSQIGDVREFTFSGSKTTTNNTSENKSTGGGGGDSTANTDNSTTSTDGITIQLPNFSVVSVNTTVSVPDGGTVLLGGIKRLSEGRNEFGVPILSKLPYVNRLFKNVGIGRETQSLMMMVTPRIIIQEEEEERLGIQAPP